MLYNFFSPCCGIKFRTYEQNLNKVLWYCKNPSRYCSRRHYSRFKSEEAVATEDLFEIDDTTFPVSSISDEDAVQKLDPASMESSIKEETKTAPRYEAQEQRRSSIGRPSRRAAEKVQSYKETPLNLKMRRED